MGNATKVALVALLILMVVVIAKLVREDSEQGLPVAKVPAASGGAGAPGDVTAAVETRAAEKSSRQMNPGATDATARRGEITRSRSNGRGASVVPSGFRSDQKTVVNASHRAGSSPARSGVQGPRQRYGDRSRSGGLNAPKPGGPSSGKSGGGELLAAGDPSQGSRWLPPQPRPRVRETPLVTGRRANRGPVTGRVLPRPSRLGGGSGAGAPNQPLVETEMRSQNQPTSAKPEHEVLYTDLGAKKNRQEAPPISIRGGGTPKPKESPLKVALTRDAQENKAPVAQKKSRTHVIEENDTLWDLSVRFYGKGTLYPVIEKANPGVKIQPGKKLVIPPRPEKSRRRSANPGPGGAPAAGTTQKAPVVASGGGGSREYLVKRGDTLSGIAKKFYGDGTKYPVIEEANRELLDEREWLPAGSKITIPELKKKK